MAAESLRRLSPMRGGIAAALAGGLAVAIGCAHRGADAPPTSSAPCEAACPANPPPRSSDAPASIPLAPVQQGYATWYGGRLAGHRTASGELFDPSAMTAAHRTLPLGTWVEVTCLDTGERVRVRINDRGPFGHSDRIIDLSRAAADRLGIRSRGIAPVAVRVIDSP